MEKEIRFAKEAIGEKIAELLYENGRMAQVVAYTPDERSQMLKDALVARMGRRYGWRGIELAFE
jgi:hypothetical protein